MPLVALRAEPVKPAATALTTVATPTSASKENFFFTLPPPNPIG
jgi:hypothetical protein